MVNNIHLSISYNIPFHLVTVSPWPLLCTLSLMNMFINMYMLFSYNFNLYLFMISFMIMMLVVVGWWRDVIRESLMQGCHSIEVLNGIRLGMLLFILSEVMFFFSFFWTYFHLSLSPSVEIGGYWPSIGIELFNPYGIPLLNTIILLTSGLSVTWAHYSILNSLYYNFMLSMMITIMLGIYFTFFQYMEYKEASFTFADSVFGSIFFLVTGFHGIHVIIGSIFLMVSFLRFLKGHFSSFHHFGFEGSVWYWHFVDVVWLFLFMSVYWWPY
uniref:Cytochrome c oxidase subunit 3 n=1 Tax=Megalyra sp. MM-2014 TaxID=1503221 RepID=A0A096XKZ5_9HYME|nr:cytochrome c oxidase subunit III [Megalyra sp. MM-2014]